ncbi:MAG: hypothetical protein EOM16_09790 [Bacteroidia bacterium]|nr:hypothetical protein [Bacteroidia bacterium]
MFAFEKKNQGSSTIMGKKLGEPLMKIVCITPVWNEIEYIGYKHNWCKNNGIDHYVINNESTDGTREWLVKNKVKFHDLDTGGSFHLGIIHKEILKTAKKIKPDWLIFLGCDLFAQTSDTLRNEITKARGNTIYFPTYIVFNSGETPGNPFHTYYYVKQYINLPLIVKWHPKITLSGDAFTHPYPKVVTGNGILINYGMTKPKKEREETLARRKKAWEKGLRWNYGKHYIKAQKKDWIWSKDKLTDIRNIHPELITNLQKQVC